MEEEAHNLPWGRLYYVVELSFHATGMILEKVKIGFSGKNCIETIR